MLDDIQFMRYSRQLLLSELGESGQEKLQSANILILGLGGLGSPAAQYLVAAGIGKLSLVDFDSVHISNLQRQILFDMNDIDKNKAISAKNRLNKINPQCQIQIIQKKLSKSELSDQIQQHDIVLDCTDNIKSRHLINECCIESKKTVITASAIGFRGQITRFSPPYENGCYACLYPDEEETIQNCASQGILGPVVGIMGTMQALETIKFLCQLQSSLDSHLCCFDGLNLTWQSFKKTKSIKCSICGEINENSNYC